MKLDEFRAKTKRWNQFSQVDTLGAFDFYTSIISLDALNATDISSIRKAFPQQGDILAAYLANKFSPEHYALLSKVLPLAAHEYTHFVDSTSTLWGLHHLSQMNEAYLSDEGRGGKETEFYKARNFYDHVKGIRLPDYYTVINPDAQDTRPWRSRITIGRIFSKQGKPSERPVLFSWFSNYQDRPLARSPISTVSLLEASAMAQELILHAALIEITEKEFRTVEQAHFQTRTLSYLYNRKFTEYSVCVHVLADRLGCKDILVAFNICARLTRLVLNFPTKAFESVLASCPIAEIIDIPKSHEFETVVRDGIKNRDLGTIYYLLCCALPKDCHENLRKSKEGIVSAFKRIGVDYDSFIGDVQEEAKQLANSIKSSRIRSLSALVNAGYENLSRIDFDEARLHFDRMNLPPAILGDSSQSTLFGSTEINSLANFNLEECFEELFQGQRWVERFSEACL